MIRRLACPTSALSSGAFAALCGGLSSLQAAVISWLDELLPLSLLLSLPQAASVPTPSATAAPVTAKRRMNEDTVPPEEWGAGTPLGSPESVVADRFAVKS
jgi:hypothetical protein